MRIDFGNTSTATAWEVLRKLADFRSTVTINGQHYVLKGRDRGDGLWAIAIDADGRPVPYKKLAAGVERRILFEEITEVTVH